MKEEFEDTKGVIKIRISKKNRQRNGQKDKQRSTKHTYKTKDRVTRLQSLVGKFATYYTHDLPHSRLTRYLLHHRSTALEVSTLPITSAIYTRG